MSEVEGAEGSALDCENAMRKRSWIAADRFALADVRRENGLSATQAYVLEQIAKYADPRSQQHRWTGALWELAEFTGHGRSTVARSVSKLVAVSLLVEIAPFVGGGTGTVEVACYDRLVVPKAEWRATPAPRPRNDHALIDADDQPKRPNPLGSEGSGEVGPRASHSQEERKALGAYRKQFSSAEEIG